MPEPQLTRIKHRPLLDGSRGILMYLVLGYHLGGIWKLPGAWVLMDFFFVLSGYLITTLLIKEYHKSGSLNLRTFYNRRARRLGPALIAMLTGVFVAAWLLGGASAFPTLRYDGIATLFYVANWRFIYSAQSYFTSFDLSPLRHAWSLAIEEQFYLIWPVVFLGMIRYTSFDRRKMLFGLGIALLLSAWWMRHLSLGDVDLSRAYYGTDTRGQGLIVGSMMALILWRERWDSPGHRIVAGWMGTAAFLVMLVMMLSFSDSSRAVYTHGGFILICVTTAVFVFGLARAESGPLHWLFGNRFALHMGAISYSFYLWHWPVIILMSPERLDWHPLTLDFSRVVVALILTEATYWFLEKPIHEQRWVLRRQGLTLGAVFAACLCLILATTYNPGAMEIPEEGSTAQSGTHAANRILVVGDSQAWVLSITAPPDLGYQIEGVFQSHCDIIGDTIYVGDQLEKANPDCAKWPRRWADGIEGRIEGIAGDPSLVLVSSGLRQLFDLPSDNGRIVVGSDEWKRHYRQAVERAIGVIRKSTSVPILWLEAACYRWEAAGTAGEEFDPQRINTINHELLVIFADYPDVYLAPYRDQVCSGPERNEVDYAQRPDGAHLTEESGAEFWRSLKPLLDKLTNEKVTGQ